MEDKKRSKKTTSDLGLAASVTMIAVGLYALTTAIFQTDNPSAQAIVGTLGTAFLGAGLKLGYDTITARDEESPHFNPMQKR